LRSSTSAAAYSTVASTLRNYLIPVYWSRDDLKPFPGVDEFYTLQDKIKTSIWSFFVKNGADRDLLVKDWFFHREKKISLTSVPQRRSRRGWSGTLSRWALEATSSRPSTISAAAWKWVSRWPLCFEFQHLATLIEAIFVINDLTGDCGSRELRTDRPRSGSPYVICTIHFPDNAVEYAEQHDWRLQGPDGMLFLYGTDVTLRRKANFKKEKERKAEKEIWRQESPTPPPQTSSDNCAPKASLWETERGFGSLHQAAKSCTLATELMPAAGVDSEAMLMAPYPHVMRKVMDLTKDYVERPPEVSEDTFKKYSKSVRQRWIRKVKKYVACQWSAHNVGETNASNASLAEVADLDGAAAAEATPPAEAQDAAAGADLVVDMTEPTAEVDISLEEKEFSPAAAAGENDEMIEEY
jgi:hypothetical protein